MIAVVLAIYAAWVTGALLLIAMSDRLYRGDLRDALLWPWWLVVLLGKVIHR